MDSESPNDNNTLVSSTVNSDLDRSASTNSSRNALLTDMELDKMKGQLEQLQSQVLKDFDEKMTQVMEEVVDEVRKKKFFNGLIKGEAVEDSYMNRTSRNSKEALPEKVFRERNSLLTDLLEIKHIRTIYHIFFVIMILNFLNTVIHDLVENGRINFGVSAIALGFGKFHKAIAIWSVLQICTFLVYPAYEIWANLRLSLQKDLRKTFDYSAIFGTVAYQFLFASFTVKSVLYFDLPPASSLALLLEMCRFIMKSHAFIRSNVPRALLPRNKSHSEDKPSFSNLPTFSKYCYFLFAPTLVYRDSYPRNRRIRWSYVGKCVIEVTCVILHMSFIFERFVIPVYQEFGASETSATSLVLSIFGCITPGILIFLQGFYLLLHCWMNAFAEMLRFADRMFYLDWWNASSFAAYYRTWNIVVHDFLYQYVYKDCYEVLVKGSKPFAMVVVFTVSAAMHEFVLAVAFRFCYPVMFVLFEGLGVAFMFVKFRNKRSAGNVFLWFGLTFGNALMLSLYNMEYMARQNCTFKDTWLNFFVPISWNNDCHGITLNENWRAVWK